MAISGYKVNLLNKRLKTKQKERFATSTSNSSFAFKQSRNNEEQFVYRTKRNVRSLSSYKLKTDQMTPFGLIGKYLATITRNLKGKNSEKSLAFYFFLLNFLLHQIYYCPSDAHYEDDLH